jgi:hypothetical protein
MGKRLGPLQNRPVAIRTATFATMFLIGSLAFAQAGQTPALPKERTIAALRKMGDVEVDDTQPGKPVRMVSLNGQRINDATLDLFCNLPELQSLKLVDTRVTDVGIRRLSGLTQLRTLFVDGAAITDNGLSALSSLRQLECLILDDTRIDGTGLHHLKPLDKLSTLHIEGPLVTAAGLGYRPNLVRLVLLNTRLTDRGLEFLRRLPNLEFLSLQDTTVTFRGLAVLRTLPRLRSLDPGVRGTPEDLDQFKREHPGIQLTGGGCGTPTSRREAELERRRLTRQGVGGRLKLAWRSLLGSIW